MFRTWNTGRLDSYLIEITAEVLAHTDAATGRPFVDVVLDQAEQKGTGRWTVQTALDLGVPVTGIAEAVFARSLSGHAGLRAAAAPDPARPGRRSAPDAERFADDVEQALYASKIVAYAQGFDQIRAGSDEYGWDIDLGAMATIWRGGCIIRARVPRPDPGRLRRRARPAHAAGRRPTSPTRSAPAQDAWRRWWSTAAAARHPRARVRRRPGLLRRAARRAAARRR